MVKSHKSKNINIHKKYICIILLTELLMVVFGILFFGSFACKGDYLYQHIVFPDVFRNLFYETGNLLPDNIWQLGAGQNIYNFSYYGLLSPVILLSYLFPWLEMKIYMQAVCAVMYVSLGVLMYLWLKNRFREREAFLGALLMIFATPVLFQFQNQIVFVECLPFVLISLIAVDEKIKNDRNSLLICSLIFLIFVNYYSSIVSLCCIMVYYGFCCLEKKDKITVKTVWNILRPVIVSILTAGILLIPTAYAITHSMRLSDYRISLWDFFNVPKYMKLYYPSEIGLTLMFVFAVFAILFNSKNKVHERFLTITVSLITFAPPILFLLNGGNYFRNKIAIPLWPLWIMIFLIMYRKMRQKRFQYRLPYIFLCVTVLAISLHNILTNMDGSADDYEKISMIVVPVGFFIISIVLRICEKTRKAGIVAGYTLLFMITMTAVFQLNIDHENHFADNGKIRNIVNKISEKDNDTYRIDNSVRYIYSINKIYSDHYYMHSVYTSTSNQYYLNFYRNNFGNGLYYRNYLMLQGSHNPLFSTYMGNRYLLSDTDIQSLPYNYVEKNDGICVYENKDAFPLIYGRRESVYTNSFKQLEFPYNMDCLFNAVVADDGEKKYQDYGIKKYYFGSTKTSGDSYRSPNGTKQLDSGKTKTSGDSYCPKNGTKQFDLGKMKNCCSFTQKGVGEYDVKLPKTIRDEYLLIKFDVKQLKNNDLRICINGYENLLTADKSEWDNQNTTFTYVISAKGMLRKLNVKVYEGHYEISNLQMYTYKPKASAFKIDRGKKIKTDHKNSTLYAELNAKSDEYMVTSFPYDEGYSIFVDGKITEKQNINDGFLGCKIKKGNHKIKVLYRSPWKKAGIICSCLGAVLFIIELIIDFRNRKNML